MFFPEKDISEETFCTAGVVCIGVGCLKDDCLNTGSANIALLGRDESSISYQNMDEHLAPVFLAITTPT
jgi:hypothetical protein